MTETLQGDDAEAGDPTRQLLDAVRDRGPLALAELLGDQAFLLIELATRPGILFDAAGGGEEAHTPEHYSAVVGRLHEQQAALQALEARAVVGLADAIRLKARADAMANAAQEPEAAPAKKATDERAERTATRELSMVTGASPARAGRTLGRSRRLVESMPEMLHALATGQAAPEKVRSAAVSVAPLSPAQRKEVDRGLARRLPSLDGAGVKRWKREVTAQIEASDPTGAARRHQHARTKRHVTVRPGEHGMATVSAHIPALDAAKIRKRLSLESERLRAHGDRRGHQAIQADTFIDTLLGREDGMDPTRLDIGVIITDRALFSPSRGDLARIEGYGPVPSESLREELRSTLSRRKQQMDSALGQDGPAARADLRRLYTHPTTGELVAMDSVGRAFPPALARFILWRDVTCRGPFCDAPIRQTDHIRPYAAGGPTCSDNGEGTCAFCNDKENQVRSVERSGDTADSGHRVTWTSSTGVTRTTTAEPLSLPDQADERVADDHAQSPGSPGLENTAGADHSTPADDVGPAEDAHRFDPPEHRISLARRLRNARRHSGSVRRRIVRRSSGRGEIAPDTGREPG
ncbi:HNH endonuclease [Brachybacterium alimentarium]|uniref:HNH endonuclease n=1 Tax=Brachybacterium alimentarium TaxID=47845 RepID=UPI003FD4DAA5